MEFLAFLAQSAERCANNFSLSRIDDFRLRNGRRFDPGRKLLFPLKLFSIALLAQSVEHGTFNLEVGGSSPP